MSRRDLLRMRAELELLRGAIASRAGHRADRARRAKLELGAVIPLAIGSLAAVLALYQLLGDHRVLLAAGVVPLMIGGTLSNLVSASQSSVSAIAAQTALLDAAGLSGAPAVNSVADKLNAVLARLPVFGGGAAVQYGTIAMASADATKTATISVVNTATTVVMLLGQTTDQAVSSNNRGVFARVDLTNATTLTADRQTTGCATTIGFVVVTFTGVASVQKGTITLAAVASNTATIAAVDVTKTILIIDGWQPTDNLWKDDVVRVALTNATTVTGSRIGITGTASVNFTTLTFA